MSSLRRRLRWLTGWWWLPTTLMAMGGGVLLIPAPSPPDLPPLPPLPTAQLPATRPLPRPALADFQVILSDPFTQPAGLLPSPPRPTRPVQVPAQPAPPPPAPPIDGNTIPINPLAQWASQQELRLIASSLGNRRSVSLASRSGIVTLLEGESPATGIVVHRVEAERVVLRQGSHLWAVGW
jgi:hypothetical protein